MYVNLFWLVMFVISRYPKNIFCFSQPFHSQSAVTLYGLFEVDDPGVQTQYFSDLENGLAELTNKV